MRYCHSSSSANSAWIRPFLLIVALCVFASWAAWAQTSDSVTLSTHVPMKVENGSAMLVGHYNPNQILRLGLAVQAPHMAEEEQFIKELLTKASPNFHKFLTAAEWNARFAPAAEDEQKVVDWAQSQGLTVTQRHPDRLMVDVEAPAGVIEKVFGVTINNYQVGDEVDFSNDRDPAIPESLSGILHTVVGLNNIERVHRLGSGKGKSTTTKGADYVPGPVYSAGENMHRDGDPAKAPWARPAAITSRAAAKDKSSGAPSQPKSNDNYPLDYMSGTYAMDPDNVQSSNGYDYNALQRLSFCCNEPGAAGGSPAESSIALVGYGGFNVSDLSTFFGYYGMAGNLTWYCIGGGSCPSNDGEAPLDVEYSGAMSNSYGSYLDTAHIFEYEMTNGLYTTYYDAWDDILTNNTAKVASTSYGWEENVGFSGSYATGTMHPLFNTMVGQGFTLIAASGDNGASDGCGDATAVDYPSADPDFIAAGGTQLNMYTNGIFYSETAWQGETWSGACGSNHGGSTGGVSVLFAAPSWQSTVVSPFYLWKAGSEYVYTGNTNRMVPDISLTANPDVLGQWYYSGGSWQDEGGTSIVAPELAGFFAQENSYLDYIGNACGGSGTSACSPVGNAAPWFYDDAIYGAPHNPFYDMLSGCSNNDITATYNLFYYCAYAGYDPITGWGSANMMQLAWGINWYIIPADGTPSLSFGGPATNTWYNTDQIIDWDLTDGSSNGYTPPGNAGFTLGWDSIPSDSHSEPHGGDGDTFYTGPEYTYSGFGCVDNNGTYCEAASGQGCHTVHVRGWDNQGNTTNGSYGPVCYDSVPPTITVSNNPTTPGSGWWDTSVVVTLNPSDPGGSDASGIKTTYYAINTGSCYPGNLGPCNTYTGPFTMSGQQQSYIYYFTEDNAGNFSTEPYEWVSIDLTPPVTTATLSGTLVSGTTFKSAVTVTLTATDTGGSGLATTYYALNSGGYSAYGGPFTVSYTGSYTVHFYSTDNAGNHEVTKTKTFTIKPVLSLSAATLAFGNELLGTTSAGKNVTITNISSSSVPITSITAFGDFSITANTCPGTLAGSGHCIVTVAFKPSVLGAITGDLTIGYSAIGSPDRLNLTGTGLAPLTATPTSLAFGTVTVGMTSAAKTVTLKNDNPSTALNIGYSSNGDYSTVTGGGTPCGATLAGGASCTVNVTFHPHQNGAINGEVTVTDGVSLSPLVVSASGSGTLGVTNPLSFTPATLAFTNVVVGTSSTKTVTVKNVSASSVNVTSVSASGDYSVSGCVGVLASGGTCTLTATFSPSTNGTIKGSLALVDGTSVSPEVLNASGTAVLPLTISPASVGFGGETVGVTTSSHTVTLTNHTAGSLSLTIGASGDFATGGGTCGASLGAGASCTFGVTFTPTTTGAV
ncbi:MAG TPA: choice-of-anchor D domain-containing protein, partial [Terriglobales bacterium]|nr:choice-of-anchor D domain-containing protein [Terriglobales bacterium]